MWRTAKVAAWTLEEARESLKRWLDADAAVATGQEYTIGERSLTRADAATIAQRIKFWKNEVETLEKGIANDGRFYKRIITIYQ